MLRALLVTDPLIVAITIFMGTLSLLASLFDDSGRTQHRIAQAWARALLRVSGVRATVCGLEKLDPSRSYVLVANHLSLMDTPLVMGLIPLQFRFFAKKGLYRIPLLGGHLRRAGHLLVVRGDARASFRSLGEGARLIQRRGISVLLFPEGGRAPGALREFHEGAAYIAIKAGVPAVPIAITGTREILPMGSIRVRPGSVRIQIGDPISTQGLSVHDHGRLTQQLRDRILERMGAPAAKV